MFDPKPYRLFGARPFGLPLARRPGMLTAATTAAATDKLTSLWFEEKN